MARTDAWLAVADALTAAGDDVATRRVVRALAALGMPRETHNELMASITGRQDPAGLLLHGLAADVIHVEDDESVLDPPPTTREMDRALEVAEALGAADIDALSREASAEDVESLFALPPIAAGDLVLGLVQRSMTLSGPQRTAGLHGADAVSRHAPSARMHVAEMLALAVGLADDDLAPVARILARVPRARLVRGVADAVTLGVDLHALAPLLERVAATPAAPPPGRPDRAVTSADDEPPVFRGPDIGPFPEPAIAAPPDRVLQPPEQSAPPPPDGAAPPERRRWWRPRWPSVTNEGVGDLVRDVLRHSPGPAGAAPAGERTAYPRLDVETHTGRPDVVVVDRPFEIKVGLAARKSAGLISAGRIALPDQEDTTVEVVVLYDPTSLVPGGETRATLTVTATTPYPTMIIPFVALYVEDAPVTGLPRRLGVQYRRNGQTVGVAFRTIVAVDDDSLVAGAAGPEVRDAGLLDLSPTLAEDAPDLVIAVIQSDTSPTSWVWTAYAADDAVTVPDGPNVAKLEPDIEAFALETRRAIQFSPDKVADFVTLAGRATRIGAAIPPGIHAAIHSLVARAGEEAPTILLLTEELVVPWELASIRPPLSTGWGGDSPFLGAHVAIGRWPLDEHKPRPTPRGTVVVRAGAVVTADYTGVPGWGKLDAAVAEAGAVAELFLPPATRVEPSFLSVIDLLRGTPSADVVHVALHGQFDNQGDQEGIVLVSRDAAGKAKAQFLTPVQVETGALAGGPFVFLNACQVGSDERVLGAYGGFASTLLRIGAAAVVAPLWNIDDDVAGALAARFYELTWTTDAPVSVAEAMRAIRATYTEAAVRAGTPGITATLVAFQIFGHPRLRLTRPQ